MTYASAVLYQKQSGGDFMKLNENTTGLVVGAFMGFFHLCWALLVAFGWAQPFMNFIFGLHFIMPPYTISAFNIGTALGLIVVTALLGYIFGWIFAKIWNWLQHAE